jgi:hypothetical protein
MRQKYRRTKVTAAESAERSGLFFLPETYKRDIRHQ